MVAALRLGLFFLFPPKEENDSSILNNQRRGISFFIPISKQQSTVDQVRTLIKKLLLNCNENRFEFTKIAEHA